MCHHWCDDLGLIHVQLYCPHLKDTVADTGGRCGRFGARVHATLAVGQAQKGGDEGAGHSVILQLSHHFALLEHLRFRRFVNLDKGSHYDQPGTDFATEGGLGGEDHGRLYASITNV